MTQLSRTTPALSAPRSTPRAVFVGLIAVNAVAMVLSFIADGVTPSWIVYPILLAIAYAVSRRNLRAGGVVMLASAALFLVVHLQFVSQATAGDECVHPANAELECNPAVWIATLGAVPAVTAIGAAFVAAAARRER